MRHWWHAQREQLHSIEGTWADPATGNWHRGVVTYSVRTCSCGAPDGGRIVCRRSIEQLPAPARRAPSPDVDPTTGMYRRPRGDA